MDHSPNKRILFVEFDKQILIISVVLMLIGLILQLDIGSSRGSSESLTPFIKQMLWIVISVPVMITIGKISRLFEHINKYIFIYLMIVIVLLTLVLIVGTTAKGGTRWLRFFGFGLQPSLPAALVLILYVSKMLEKKQLYIARSNIINFIRDFMPMLISVILVFGLIYFEKHLSTLLVLGASIIGIFFVSNIRMSTLVILIGLTGILTFVSIKGKEEYRSSRMDIFSKYSLYHKALKLPISQEETNDYQVKESLTAISSGRIFGTGFSKGRAKHYFLPDAKSDYIFAVIGEQFGYIGALFILFLYTYLFYRCCQIAWLSKQLSIQLAGIGLSLNFYLTALVNIGVAISAIPPTGLTLPFVSYGGSSLLFNAVNIGLILNMSAQRKVV